MPRKMNPELAGSVLDGLMRHSSVILFVKDPDGRYLAVSDGWEAVTRVPATTTLGRDDFAVFGPVVGGAFRQADLQVLAADHPLQLEEYLQHPEGPQYFTSTKFPLRDRTGKLLGICGVALDITPLRRMQQAVRTIMKAAATCSGETLMQLLVQQIAQVIGADYCFLGKLLPDNNSVRTLVLVEHGQIGSNITYSLSHTPCESVFTGTTCIYANQIQQQFPADIMLQDLNVQAYVGTPIRDSRGEVSGIIVSLFRQPLQDQEFIRDLFDLFSGRIGAEMERLAREQEIVQLNSDLEKRVEKRTQELQHALQEVEMFNYCVSHDLKAPLRAIKGFADILLEDEQARLSADGREMLQRIFNASRRMQQQIDALNTLVQLDSKPLQRKRVNLSELALRVLDTVADVDIRSRLQLDIAPDLSAYCDPALAELVFIQLFENAIKYSRHRASPYLACQSMHRNGKDYIVVEDNGVGFSMDYVGKLFSPFQRLHSAREFGGEGIGLAMVARIIYRHGGELWAEGEPDKGARIGFRFANGD